MAESLSEDDVLEAIARHIGRPGQGPQLRRTGADITWLPMLDLRVVRSVETRTTRPETRPGRYDLSGLSTYEGKLRDHPVEPPSNPARPRRVELVLSGSARTVDCGCDEGRQPCSRCRAKGKLVCEIGPSCPACKVWNRAPGATARANAARTGRRPDRRGRVVLPGGPPV